MKNTLILFLFSLNSFGETTNEVIHPIIDYSKIKTQIESACDFFSVFSTVNKKALACFQKDGVAPENLEQILEESSENITTIGECLEQETLSPDYQTVALEINEGSNPLIQTLIIDTIKNCISEKSLAGKLQCGSDKAKSYEETFCL